MRACVRAAAAAVLRSAPSKRLKSSAEGTTQLRLSVATPRQSRREEDEEERKERAEGERGKGGMAGMSEGRGEAAASRAAAEEGNWIENIRGERRAESDVS